MFFKESLQHWMTENALREIRLDDDVFVEARENLYRFAVPSDQVTELTVDEICQFVQFFLSLKSLQLLAVSPDHKVLAYVWFDEMAGVICIGFISNRPGQSLPFSCRVNAQTPLSSVVQNFVDSKYLDGIPFAELSSLDVNEPEVMTEHREELAVFVSEN